MCDTEILCKKCNNYKPEYQMYVHYEQGEQPVVDWCEKCIVDNYQMCGNCEFSYKNENCLECTQCHTTLCIHCVNNGENLCQGCLVHLEEYYKNFEIEVYTCNICKYTSQDEVNFYYCQICNIQHCLNCSDPFYAICIDCCKQQGDCAIELQNLKIR